MTCKYTNNRLFPCQSLSKALDHNNPTTRARGVYLPERVNVKTGQRGTDIVQIHSGSFVGRGIAAEFCPFCGARIAFWEKTG